MSKSQKKEMHPIDWSKTDLHRMMVRFSALTFAIFLLAVGCQHCNQWFQQDDDWWFEEVVEEVIESEVGLNIDLTPNTPEKNED